MSKYDKQDGVGPIDNWSSTDWLQHYDKKMLTLDTWHVTPDMSHMVGVNILSKCQLPSYYGLG